MSDINAATELVVAAINQGGLMADEIAYLSPMDATVGEFFKEAKAILAAAMLTPEESLVQERAERAAVSLYPR